MYSPFVELEHKLEQVPVSRDDVERLLKKMDHDLDAAEYNREKAPDWVLKMASEAILSDSTALMAARGYHAKVNGHHYMTIRFAQLALPQYTALLDRAEMLRRRRHQVTYGTVYVVSAEEMEGTLELAHQLTAILKKEAALKALEQAEAQEKPQR